MGMSGWQSLEIKTDWNVLLAFQPSHLDYVLSSTVLGGGSSNLFHYSFSLSAVTLHSQFSSFWIFVLTALQTGNILRNSLLHGTLLKIIQVKLLAKESALEEHQLCRV